MTSPIIGATTRYSGGYPVGVDYTYDPAGPSAAISSNQLTTGEECFPREFCNSAGAAVPASGQVRFTYFTARKTETTTQVRMYSGTTAAAATPTLCKMGLYKVEANGDLTRCAVTANDTTLFSATLTGYTRAWTAPYEKVAGTRYAVGALVVSAATMPIFPGNALSFFTAESAIAPMMGSVVSSLADFPASITSASATANGQRPYVVVLP